LQRKREMMADVLSRP